jgi:hypothetical protein
MLRARVCNGKRNLPLPPPPPLIDNNPVREGRIQDIPSFSRLVLTLHFPRYVWNLPSSKVLPCTFTGIFRLFLGFSVFGCSGSIFECEGRVLALPGFSWEFGRGMGGVGVNVMYREGGVVVLSLFIALL